MPCPRILRLIDELGVSDRVRVLGLIPRADAIALIRKAAFVVQPSLFEGWSALVEEARTLGKALVLSDIAIHREQAPPLAQYFPPEDVHALADAMERTWHAPEVNREGSARRSAQLRAAAFARRFLYIAETAISQFQQRYEN